MKRNSVIKFLGVLICVAVLVSPVGWSKQGKQSQGMQAFAQSISSDDNPQTKQRIKEIDKEIARRKASIEQNNRLGSWWLAQQTMYHIQNAPKAGGPRGQTGESPSNWHDGSSNAEHALIDYRKRIARVKPENEREKRLIYLLNQEKSRLLGQQRSACFPGETRVLTEAGLLKPIEQINPGDRVMTFDIGAQADIPKPVLNTYKSGNNHYYVINNAVKVTALERFLTPDGWKKVLNLKQGDKIHTSQGLEPIRSLVVQYGPLEVHNLHVEGSHTFYVVGEDEKLYLVHNTGGGGGSGNK